MHLMKNLCVNLMAFLGVYEKPKDTLEAHQELQCMEEQVALHPQQLDNGREYLSPASYTLSKEEKESMFEFLSSINVPSGYSSNIKGILNLAEKKFTNLKSHDCHVLMTELLPVVLVNDDAPYLRHDHNQGTFVKRKSVTANPSCT